MQTTILRMLVLGICSASANAQVITTVVGTDWTFPPTPIPALDAPFGSLGGVAVDPSGNVYLTDAANARVFRITPPRVVTIVAGNGRIGFFGDGGQCRSGAR